MNIGLIGFGSMGKTHFYSVSNMGLYFGSSAPKAAYTGICTSSSKTAESARKITGCDTFTDEDEIIYSDDIDIVDICTPNIYHYDTVKKALLSGKHVFCEKPLSVTYAQAKELADIQKSTGLVCGINFNYRYMSGVIKAKQLISDGRIGTPVSFSFEFSHASCTDVNKNAGWKQNKDICGGGVLFDLGSHMIDLTSYLLGDFSDISGRGQIAHPVRKGADGHDWNTNADEAFYMTAGLENGAVGYITASKLAYGTNDDMKFTVYGDCGAVSYSLMQPNYLRFYDGKKDGSYIGGDRGFTDIECVGRYPSPGGTFPSPKGPVGILSGHIYSLFDYLTGVETGHYHGPDFACGAYVQKVMERAYESDENGSVRVKI